MSELLQKWIEAAVIVADAENMSDDEVIPTWPDFCVESFPDRYPQLTVGALREWQSAGAQCVGVGPVITTEMKIECMGEFSWQEEAPYYDEDGEVHDHVATHVVPWDICKDIYKRMAKCAPQPGNSAHPDDLAVDRFAEAMKKKMAQKRKEGRWGWEEKESLRVGSLQKMLINHLSKGDPVDVGNFAMMLWNRGELVSGRVGGEEDPYADACEAVEEGIHALVKTLGMSMEYFDGEGAEAYELACGLKRIAEMLEPHGLRYDPEECAISAQQPDKSKERE